MGVFYFHPSRVLFSLCVAFLAICFVGTFFEDRIAFLGGLYAHPREELDQWRDQPQTFSATVISEVERRKNRQEAVIATDGGEVGPGWLVTRLFPELEVGMKVRLRCTPRAALQANGIDVDQRLRLKRVFWQCRYPRLSIEGRGGSGKMLWLFRFKQWGLNTINRSFPEPHASLIAGLLFGVRRSMPDPFYQALQKTGTVHVIAISGYNISLVLAMVLGMIERLHLPRWARLPAGGVGLFLFVILTGASASVVRAGLMGGLGVLAITLGRKQLALHLLVIAAAIMAAMQPLIVRFDVGFQLSFFATLGLICGSSALEKRLGWIPDFFSLRQTTAATLATNLAVTPLLIYYFGSISLVAVLVNLVILPLIPWIMLGGAIFLIFAFLFPWIMPIASLPSLVLLHGVVTVIERASAFPFAQWVLRPS